MTPCFRAFVEWITDQSNEDWGWKFTATAEVGKVSRVFRNVCQSFRPPEVKHMKSMRLCHRVPQEIPHGEHAHLHARPSLCLPIFIMRSSLVWFQATIELQIVMSWRRASKSSRSVAASGCVILFTLYGIRSTPFH